MFVKWSASAREHKNVYFKLKKGRAYSIETRTGFLGIRYVQN